MVDFNGSVIADGRQHIVVKGVYSNVVTSIMPLIFISMTKIVVADVLIALDGGR